ncbi:MAG: ABC transporter ATP-binding protein, partial [Acidimicrobiales bacterium]
MLERAWRFARPYRTKMGLYLATIIGTALLNALTPLVFKAIIDRAIPHHSIRLLTLYVGVVLLITVGQSAIGVLNRYLSAAIGEGLIFRLRTALFEHVQAMSISFFSHSKTGALLSRLNNDVLGAQQTITTFASVLSDLFTLGFTLYFMLSLSPAVTGASLLLVPAILILDRRVGGRLTGYARRQMQANATMSAMEEERFNVAGALLVALFGNRGREAREFRGHAEGVRDAGIQLALSSRLYFTALSLLAGIGTVAVYYLGGRQVIGGTLSLGALVALAQYVGRLYSPLTDLASSRVSLLQALVAFERVFEVLDTPIDLEDNSDASSLDRLAGAIRFDSVSFRYPVSNAPASLTLDEGTNEDQENRLALSEISFEVLPGARIALVGPSGAGKTTITNLLLRLYDPSEGAIFIDGHDLRSLALQNLRDLIGVVSQDPHLFHDSIANNLRYVAPGADMDGLVEATTAAQIHEFILTLPDGYDTVVGERGYRLSGGEKQRLSIARVFLKRPSVVVLDEATSSLDSENEQRIQQALDTVLEGRTAL